MSDIEKEKQKKRKRWIFATAVILVLVFFTVATNMDVLVKWFIPADAPPTITLLHPGNHEVITNNTTYFNWTGYDPEGDTLWYVWYCDALSTFTSPFYRAVDVNITENYTALPFMDGNYYFRVEVTDNTSVVVSNTRHFIIRTNASNNFPVLSNPMVLPTIGYNVTNFTYSVIFTDLDNDTADYMRVYIDGTMYNMTENNPIDVTTYNGKTYVYKRDNLSVGSHTFQYTCSDGIAIGSSDLLIGPVVQSGSPPVTPPTPPTGGEILPQEKMNKITIQPKNIQAYPGNSFTGSLSITEEGHGNNYEVFWYIFLLDSDDNEIGFNTGALAISTTVVVPYDIPTPVATPIGGYRLLAKTYDAPREKITAKELGMDTINVEIISEPPGLELIKPFFGNFPLMFILLIIGAVLPFIAWRHKKGWMLIGSIGIIMLLLLIFEIVKVNFWSFIAIVLIMTGCSFFTGAKKYLPIKNKRNALLIGGILIFAGFILYFLPYL